MMYITDMNGRKFEIKDMEGSIELVKAYLKTSQSHKSKSLQMLEENRLRYWEDVHDKLLEEKSRSNLKA